MRPRRGNIAASFRPVSDACASKLNGCAFAHHLFPDEGPSSMRVLVVEDNRSLVANLFDYFEARGHVLDAAPDGPTGLHLSLIHI